MELVSQQIADRHNNPDFVVLISRLSDIESHGTLPSIYRLYSLCCIYRLDLIEVLGWFGIPVDSMTSDAGMVQMEKTHAISLNPEGAEVLLPISLDPGIDLRRTFFVSEVVQRWGKLPLALVGGIDVKRFRYGFVGTEDWSMNPTIPAGALLVIDDSKRKIQMSGWRNQAERPIYFHRAPGRVLLPLVQREGWTDQPDPGSVVGGTGADVSSRRDRHGGTGGRDWL